MFGLGVQNEIGQRLTEFCQENTLVIANTLFQQPKRWLHTRTSPDDQHQNQTDYILCSWKWSSIELLKHWASLTAQQIKNPPAMQETKGGTGSILGSGRSRGRKWQPTPVFLPEKSHGHRNLAGYSPKDCKRVRQDWIHVCYPLYS